MNDDKKNGAFPSAVEQANTLLHPAPEAERAASFADGVPTMYVDQEGFVCLYRKIQDSPVWKDDALLLKTWLWCILKAAWKDHETVYRMQPISIKRGQFVFGRKVAARELNCTEDQFRTRIAILIRLRNITIRPTERFTTATVCNYDSYQLSKTTKPQQNPRPIPNQSPTNPHNRIQ